MEVNTLEIGELSDKVLMFGGVYSNFHALQSLKEFARQEQIPASNIICTGDIVGYCAQPEECVSLIRDWGIHCIAGNVEIQLGEDEEDCGCDFAEGSRCDGFSKVWYPFAKQNLSDASLKWMSSLPEFIRFTHSGKSVFVLHGSVHHTSEFIFKSTPSEIKILNFSQTGSDVIVAGHSGIPFIDTLENHTWVNAGVIGMPPNNGKSSVWCAVSNDFEIFKFKELNYDFASASELMIRLNLNKEYALTLRTGIWDNCEILPPKETSEQGLKLNF